MKHPVIKKQHPSCIQCFLIFTFVLITHVLSAQTVDCSNDANCNDPYCQPAVGKERGCQCFDGIDNDGDGTAQIPSTDRSDLDCAQYYGLTFINDGSNCPLPTDPDGNPFTAIGKPSSSDQNTADTQAKVSVGDIDGDGIPDAIITSKWNSEVRVVATSDNQIDGSDVGDIKSDFKTTGQGATYFSGTGGCDPKNLLFEHENMIADIGPNPDGTGEIFTVVSNRQGNPESPPTCFYLMGFRYAPNDLDPLYTKAIVIGSDRPGTFGIADFDGDGLSEIYLRDRIYAAETGALLATGNGNWDLDVTSAPVAANILGDNKLELICGTKIFSIPSLTNRNPATPTVMTPIADMNDGSATDLNGTGAECYVKLMLDPLEYGNDTHSSTSVADVNADGFLDVVISGALNSTSGKTAVFFWDVHNNRYDYYLPADPVYANGWPWGTGRINLYDVGEGIDSDGDGVRERDGKLEMTFIAGNQLHCLSVDSGGNIIPYGAPATGAIWTGPLTINDSRSGVLTVTIYDFDNDGKPEIVYRDSQELVIIDGITKTREWSSVCQSHTYTEGPIIADVNGDGNTDICVTCNTSKSFKIDDGIQQQALGQIRLYFSNPATDPWLPTRQVWNQPGYFVTNINDDLTLPFPQLDQNLVFGNGECAGFNGPQRPMNVFLNQVPYLNQDGCPVFPFPDLEFTEVPEYDSLGNQVSIRPAVEVIPPICGNIDIKVRFNIVNNGYLPITANIPVSFFKKDPRTTNSAADRLHSAVIPVNLPVDSTYSTPYISFNGSGEPFMLYIVLNNSGAVLPINLAAPVPNECQMGNNLDSVFVDPTPFIATPAVRVLDEYCNGVSAQKGELEVTLSKGGVAITDFSPYTFQWYSDTTGTAGIPSPAGDKSVLINRQSGWYSILVTDTTKGCNSGIIPIKLDSIDFRPQVSINILSHQTNCTPFNGKLKAVIAGDSLGYTYRWLREQNPLIPTTSTIDGLEGAPSGESYTLIATNASGCEGRADTLVYGPTRPLVHASVVQHVVNCLSPNAGTITAIHEVPGQPTNIADTANYSFQWYYYNNGVQGSILPNGTEINPTRSGLPAGSYQVVLTNLTTQCTAIQRPVVTIADSTVLPTLQMQRIQTQTSCDPNNPNGILGVTVNPVGPTYKYEWFEGQNTLAINAVGTNNSQLSNVKGGGLSYTVKVTNITNDCFVIADTTALEILSYPVVDLDSINNSICDQTLGYNGSATANLTYQSAPVTDFTPFGFTWHVGSGETGVVPAPNSTGRTLGQQKAGFYTVVAQHLATACKSVPRTIEIQDILDFPDITADADSSTNCLPAVTGNGRVKVTDVDNVGTPTATYNFSWHRGITTAGTLIANQAISPDTLQGATGNFYTVLVRNKTNGCEDTETVEVSDFRVIPTLQLTATPNGICDSLLAEPNASYSGAVRADITNLGSNAINGYRFIWTDNENGAQIQNALGSAVVPGIGGQFLNNRDSSFYSVRATNVSTGCVSALYTAQVMTIVNLPVINAIANASTNCLPLSASRPGNGSVQVQTVDGAAPNAFYDIDWFSGSDTSGALITANSALSVDSLKGAFDKFYTTLVTDLRNGCQSSQTVQLPDASAKPVITLEQLDPNTMCDPGPYNGRLRVNSISYKNAPYAGLASNLAFTWYDTVGIDPARDLFINNDTLSGRRPDSYSATVRMIDLNCTSDFVTIDVTDEPVTPAITIDVAGSTNCPGGNPNGSADVTAVVPADGYSYKWYSGNFVAGAIIDSDTLISNIQGSATAFYTVEVTRSSTNCKNTQTVLVPDNSVLPVLLPLSDTPNTKCADFGSFNGAVSITGVTYQGNPVASPYTGYTFTWSGGSPSTGANLPSIDSLAAGMYSLTIRKDDVNCTSNPAFATVLDSLVYPDIATEVLKDQTSCDPNFANGQLQVNITGGAAGMNIFWHRGIGTTGQQIGNVVTTLDTLSSSDYTVRVVNTNTSCASTQSLFLPNNIVIPKLSFANINPVTRCDSPNGNATVQLTDISGGANPNFFVYYVFTQAGNTFPSSGTTVKASPTTIYNGTTPFVMGVNPPVYANLAPGYVTALVRDSLTHCESAAATVEIENQTIDSEITVLGKSTAGFCGGDGGGIDVDVTGGVAPYTYEWYNATPTNVNINFFNNPPNMGGAPVLAVTQDLGAPGTPPGVGAGPYTLIVRDNVGCGTYFVESVPFAGAPVVTITPTDVTKCIAPFNGELAVTVAGAGTYSIAFYPGNGNNPPALRGEICDDLIDNDGDGLIDAADPDCSMNNITLSGLQNGDYYIEVIDYTPANRACPLGFGRTLEQKAFSPIVAINGFTPNTFCNSGNDGDGTITLTASQQSEDTTIPNYSITAISPVPTTSTVPFALVEGAATVLGSPTFGFGSQTYTFTITDGTTGCFTSASATVPDQPKVPELIDVEVTPDSVCNPNTNGRITVLDVLPAAVNDYEYFWYSDVTLADTLYNAMGGAGGTIFDGTKPGWKLGPTVGLGNGPFTYYVRGVRRLGQGQGCTTAAVMKVVQDVHITPAITLVPLPNTSCLPLVGEGSISVTASTSSPSPAIASGLYDYTLGAATGDDQDGSVPFVFGGLLDNNGTPQTYTVTAFNTVSGCKTEGQATIMPSKFSLSITDTTFQHQMICNPDGRIEVTQITVDRSLIGRADSVFANPPMLSTDFDFQWFRASDSNPGVFNPGQPLTDGVTPITGEVLADGSGAGQYDSMRAGTYYVIAQRKNTAPAFAAGCLTPPLRIDILDQHINPVVSFTPFSNTSCNNVFEGSMKVFVSDTTAVAGPFNYQYEWIAGASLKDSVVAVNNGDGNGMDGDGDNPQNIQNDTYQLLVTNNITGCQVVGATTILKNESPIFLASIDSLPQLHCFASGEIRVTDVQVLLPPIDPITGIPNNPQLQSQPMVDFTYTWVDEATGVPLPDTGILLDTLLAGTYNVTATRSANGPGRGCSSAPYRVVLPDLRAYPTVTLTPSVNTSCSDLPGDFEGSIRIQVAETREPGAGEPYRYQWVTNDATNPLNGISRAAVNDGDGSIDINGNSADGDFDVERGLKDDTYTLTVVNDSTLCQVTASTTIIKATVPVIIAEAHPEEKLFCRASGKAIVDRVEVGGFADNNMNNFNFLWSEGDVSTLITNLNLPTQGLSRLDSVAYDSITLKNTLVYYVVAERRNDAPSPGKGCKSAPVRVDIPDNSTNPTVTLTPFANVTCNTNYTGRIQIQAYDNAGPGIGSLYRYTWAASGGNALNGQVRNNNDGDGAMTVGGTSADGDFDVEPGLMDDIYQVIVSNNLTLCETPAVITIIKDTVVSLPNIVRIDPDNPTTCLADGNAFVREVTIGGDTTYTNAADLDNLFDYKWYRGNMSQEIIGEVNATLPNIGPGVYYATVETTFSGCSSLPTQVILDTLQIAYPQLLITQTQLQVSCTPTAPPTAQLVVLATTNDTEPVPGTRTTRTNYGNFDIEWFNSLDTVGTVIATDTVTGLIDHGQYSVKVRDNVTNCPAMAIYIVPDDGPRFKPLFVVNKSPVERCEPPFDGSFFVQMDTSQFQGQYPFPTVNYRVTLLNGDRSAETAETLALEPTDYTVTTNSPLIYSQAQLNNGPYTIVVLDQNTGCPVAEMQTIDAERRLPVIDIHEDNPLTNCPPVAANGQLSATADGGRIGGYRFVWYEGRTITNFADSIQVGHQLIGQEDGAYTVRVRNELTDCVSQEDSVIRKIQDLSHIPTAELVQNRTNCLYPNGWATASVKTGIEPTLPYIFRWYDGNVANPVVGAENAIGPDYMDLPEQIYTVTAERISTGCVSPPDTVIVRFAPVYPNLIFKTTASVCRDLPNYPAGTGTIEMTLDPSDVITKDILWKDENGTPISFDPSTNDTLDLGNYVTGLYPGEYEAIVTTSEDCEVSGRAVVATEILSYNLITVNGDQKNDGFVIDCISRFPNNNVKIFNRSGVKVYDADHYDNIDVVFDGIGKDGIYTTGNNLPSGTYFYIIDKGDGSKPKTGYLELVK